MYWMMWLLAQPATAGDPCSSLTRQRLVQGRTYRAASVCLGLSCLDQLALGRLADGTPVWVTTLQLQPARLGASEPMFTPVRSVRLSMEGGPQVLMGPSKVIDVSRRVDSSTGGVAQRAHIVSAVPEAALQALVAGRLLDVEVVLDGKGFGNSRLLEVPRGWHRRLQRAARCLIGE